ncbi:hypothetical protein BJ742DRAFT_758891 [Cladochytrium replicatum]|nr:hypothetical protein BJ742DRAFT_758891 [Cladochytrium replicatum]
MDTSRSEAFNAADSTAVGALDIALVCDNTGSMGSYIQQSKESLSEIVRQISSFCDDVRFSVIAYRDHPPQDTSYVTKVTPLTNDLQAVRAAVDDMRADGGGDGPESVCCALKELTKLDYRQNAGKAAVFIADAPPHGLSKKTYDGFPKGCPVHSDPFSCARNLAGLGVSIYSVACEPSLGGFENARAFFAAISKITGGLVVNSRAASILPGIIVSSARETLSLAEAEREIAELEQTFRDNQRELGKGDIVRAELLEFITLELKKRGVKAGRMNLVKKSTNKTNAKTKPVDGTREARRYTRQGIYGMTGTLNGACKELEYIQEKAAAGEDWELVDDEEEDADIVSVQVEMDFLSLEQVDRVLKRTSQALPMTKFQVKNPEGGYTFKMDDIRRLNRFLILGSDSGTFSSKEPALTTENAEVIIRLLNDGRGMEVVNRIVDVSLGGLAVKQNPLIFALALCARRGSEEIRRKAFEVLPKICRIPTFLFMFVRFLQLVGEKTVVFTEAEAGATPIETEPSSPEANRVKAEQESKNEATVAESPRKRKARDSTPYHGKGWGRSARRAISSWYVDVATPSSPFSDPINLAFSCTKFKNREGWTHADVLRMAHPKPTAAVAVVLSYLLGGFPGLQQRFGGVVEGIEKLSLSAPEDAEVEKSDAAAEIKNKKKRAGKVKMVKDRSEEGPDMKDLTDNQKFYVDKVIELFKDLERVKEAGTSDEEIAQLVHKHHLAREHIPPERLKSRAVWKALFKYMPLGGLLRNLNRLTVAGVLVSPSSPPSPYIVPSIDDFEMVEAAETSDEGEKKVKPLKLGAEDIVNAIDLVKSLVKDGGRLVNAAALKRARIHPLELLVALKTYGSGKGDKGSLVWTPIPEIVDALEKAFALSFEGSVAGEGDKMAVDEDRDEESGGAVEGVQQLGGRVLVAIDVSASMTIPMSGSVLTAREASAALAVQMARTEPNVTIVGFSDELVRLPITRASTFREAVEACEGLPPGATDCALPLTWALKQGMDVDTFIVLTDSETWCGGVHPKQALDMYRKVRGIESRLVVVGMTSTEFSIADPEDAGMLDVVGFDPSMMNLIRRFVAGEF